MANIDDFPTLKRSLGAAGADRIRNHQLDKMSIGGPRTRWTPNPFQGFLSGLQSMYADRAVDDILTGIAALDQGTDKNLSATRLFTLLACNKRISTELIKVTMNIAERQARKYMAAAKLAIFHLKRAGVDNPIVIEDLIGNPWAENCDHQPQEELHD
jgi:hypothetical protein